MVFSVSKVSKPVYKCKLFTRVNQDGNYIFFKGHNRPPQLDVVWYPEWKVNFKYLYVSVRNIYIQSVKYKSCDLLIYSTCAIVLALATGDIRLWWHTSLDGFVCYNGQFERNNFFLCAQVTFSCAVPSWRWRVCLGRVRRTSIGCVGPASGRVLGKPSCHSGAGSTTPWPRAQLHPPRNPPFPRFFMSSWVSSWSYFLNSLYFNLWNLSTNNAQVKRFH